MKSKVVWRYINPKNAKPGEFKQTLRRLDQIVEKEKGLHPRLRHFLEKIELPKKQSLG